MLLAEGPRALVTPIKATRMEVGFLKPTKASSMMEIRMEIKEKFLYGTDLTKSNIALELGR